MRRSEPFQGSSRISPPQWILRRTVRGNRVFYQADPASPIFEELKSIFTKTSGLVDQIRRALLPLADRIAVVLVYGSAARGGLRASSDVDLLVVGRASFGEVVAALAGAQSALGREINPVVYSASEFRSKLRARHHVLTSLMGEPLQFVIGGPGDLERLGAKRLGPRPPHEPPVNRGSSRHRRPRSGR